MIDSKDLILNNIKKALAKTAGKKNVSLDNIFLNNFPKISENELINQFTKELLKVNGEIKQLKAPEELTEEITDFLNKNKIKNFLIWETDLLKENDIKSKLESRGLTRNKSSSIKKLAESDVGITEVDYAIADTGTLVLFSNSKKPRIHSVLAPVHIAILKSENILSNIHELFLKIKTNHHNLTDVSSCMTFITGPSRTADIELSLTLGVHGPGRLIVFLI